MKNQLRENESRANPIFCLEYSGVNENPFHPGKNFVKGGKKLLCYEPFSKMLFNKYSYKTKKPPRGG